MEYLPKYCYRCKGVKFDIVRIPYNVLAMIVYYSTCIKCNAVYESLEEFGG